MADTTQLRRNGTVQEYVPDDMLPKCASLVDKYKLDVGKFASHLDAYMINKEITVLSLDQMGKFEQFLLAENKKAANKPPPAPISQRTPASQNSTTAKRPFEASTPTGDEYPSKRGADAVAATADSPIYGDSQMNAGIESQDFAASNIVGSSGGEAYKNRKGKGEPALKAPLNADLGGRGRFEPSEAKPLGMRCRISTNDEEFENCKGRYRYMFTPLRERALALDKHLLRLQDYMCEKAKLPVEDLQPVGIPSPELVWVCGRICCDAAEGKINKQSVVLEGSNKDSNGRRVKLELGELSAYSLFPGQIVLVEGICASGRTMAVKRIVEGFPLETPTTSPERLLEYHHSNLFQKGQALKVITAAGPFTTSDSLDYAPLRDLMIRVIREKPDVLILVGPFVDSSQPMLAGGDVMLEDYDEDDNIIGKTGASYEMVFTMKIIRDGLTVLFNSEEEHGTIPTNIVMIPSLQDAHHECVFPQPPFGDRDEVKTEFLSESLGVLNVPFSTDNDIRKRVHLLPNPCMFRINEVLFGVTSNDALFALSSDEVSLNVGANRLARLAAHLLQQQSFCPQFPVPQNALAQLDMRHARHWQMKTSPDVLICPSKLTFMARDVLGTLVVNPGLLTKGVNGGTYAELNIHPMDEKKLRDQLLEQTAQVKNEVHSRTYANIIKI